MDTKKKKKKKIMVRPLIHKTPEARMEAARKKRQRYYAKYVALL